MHGPKEKGSYMALTIKMLKELGIEHDSIEAIVKAHGETVDGLKAERDAALDRASEAEEKAAKAGKDEADKLQKKFDDEHAAFEKFKADVKAERDTAEKAGLYRALLKKAGVDERRLDAIMRVTDLSKVNVKEGKIEGEEDLESGIKETWADFIGTASNVPAKVDTPPASDPAKPEASSLADALHQKYD